MTARESLDQILHKDYRKPFALLIAVCAVVALALTGIDSVERFVDGRVDMRATNAARVAEDHERRLGKLEGQLDDMQKVLGEIRGDVRVLRDRSEKRR